MFSVQVPLARGTVVNFAESLRTVQEDLRELSPQVFFGVPRIWEKFHAAIQTKLRETGTLRRGLALTAMRRMAPDVRGAARDSWLGGIERQVWYWLVLRSLQNYIGMRRCRVAFSAGAPIAPDVLRFFRTRWACRCASYTA